MVQPKLNAAGHRDALTAWPTEQAPTAHQPGAAQGNLRLSKQTQPPGSSTKHHWQEPLGCDTLSLTL
jgi:hypothetical protein